MDGYIIDAVIAGFVVGGAIEVGMGFVALEEVVGGNGLVRFEVKVAATLGAYEEVEGSGGCCECGIERECDR